MKTICKIATAIIGLGLIAQLVIIGMVLTGGF